MSAILHNLISSRQNSMEIQDTLSENDVTYLTENTDMKDRDAIQLHFKTFLSHHPRGCITKKDFKSLFVKCYSGGDCDKLAKRIFNMYDKNRDGTIRDHFRELMAVMYVMSNGTPEDNLREIFRVFDENNDGVITREEMISFVKDIDHLLTEEELPQPEIKASCIGTQSEFKKARRTIAEKAFLEMDVNRDGKVTEDEFVEAVLKHQKTALMLAMKIVQVFDPDLVRQSIASKKP